MTDKKEISLEELDNVRGGIWTDEAQRYIALNWDKIYELLGGDMDRVMRLVDTYSSFDKSKQVFDLNSVKALLGFMCIDTSKLVDYDPNNPEHVNKVQR